MAPLGEPRAARAVAVSSMQGAMRMALPCRSLAFTFRQDVDRPCRFRRPRSGYDFTPVRRRTDIATTCSTAPAMHPVADVLTEDIRTSARALVSVSSCRVRATWSSAAPPVRRHRRSRPSAASGIRQRPQRALFGTRHYWSRPPKWSPTCSPRRSPAPLQAGIGVAAGEIADRQFMPPSVPWASLRSPPRGAGDRDRLRRSITPNTGVEAATRRPRGAGPATASKREREPQEPS